MSRDKQKLIAEEKSILTAFKAGKLHSIPKLKSEKNRIQHIIKTQDIHPSEIKLTFLTSQGPGGQNVNKVATAVQLRFDVLHAASLSDDVRLRLILLLGKKLTSQGELIIKANRYRTQERNKQDALNRLKEWIQLASTPPKKRKKTKPTRASKERRLTQKKRQGAKKSLRRAAPF